MDNKQVFQKHQKKVKFQVDSKYSILEIIGEGAYGVVCSAVDTTNGQRVAIKKICGVFDVPSITKRTLREIKILKHFKHDNIISIKEILRPPSNVNEFSDVYVVMDLMGSDLHHIIHSKQDLSQEHIRYFLYQLLRGLKYIHSANIIHRDLKPSNLLINKDCELKIGDFGMARSLSASLSEKKRVMTEYVATRWYRAPELMLSVHQFTKAIDVWSVGCIFAEMLGREALFPGSNYLNQLQLILSVVGVPSVEFMATITSERVRSYIGRLPHKSPVSFDTMYPKASQDAIELLSQLLILDPGKRVSVENALKKPFVEKYHDLDDEPTSRIFDYDIESIPMEKDKLKEHILQEIQYYHSKRAKPNLAPIQTDLLKSSFKLPMITPSTPVVRFNDVPQNVTVPVNPEQKRDSKKRKHKTQPQNSTSKKKPSQPDAQPKTVSNELSSQDKELLQRWSNMQKDSKPFIHPIRKHMDELLQIKAADSTVGETAKGQAIVDRVSTTNKMTTPLQFTNFVPKQKNGGVALVPEQTVKMPSTVVISSVASSTLTSTLNVTTMKTSTANRNIPVRPAPAPTPKAPQTILIPVGNVPMFQLQCAFGDTAPIVIIPNLAAPKVSAPVHIAPKPVQVSNVSMPYKIVANSNTIIAPSISKQILPNICVTKPSTKVVHELSKSEYEPKNDGVLLDKNRSVNQPGGKILIKISNPSSVSITEVISRTDTCSSMSNPVSSSKIHFNIGSEEDKRSSTNSCLKFDSEDSSDNSKKSEMFSGELSSRILHSGGSFLSELTISSAELDSAQSSAQSSAKEIPQPQVSPEECAHVIAQVKRLDEEDKKIVCMIEELEESSNSSKYEEDSKSDHVRSDDNRGSNKDNSSMPSDNLPCTTVPSSHTDNWSIVKNMLVNSIKAKQMKKAQLAEKVFPSEPDTFIHTTNSNPTISSITSITLTSNTLTTTLASKPNSPLQQVANATGMSHREFLVNTTVLTKSQSEQDVQSTNFTTNTLTSAKRNFCIEPSTNTDRQLRQESITKLPTDFTQNYISSNLKMTKNSTNEKQYDSHDNLFQVSKHDYSRELTHNHPSPDNLDNSSQKINFVSKNPEYSSPLNRTIYSDSSSSLIQQPLQSIPRISQPNQPNQHPRTTTNVSQYYISPLHNSVLTRSENYVSNERLSSNQGNADSNNNRSSFILHNRSSTRIQSNNPLTEVATLTSDRISLPTLDAASAATSIERMPLRTKGHLHQDSSHKADNSVSNSHVSIICCKSSANFPRLNLVTCSNNVANSSKTIRVTSQFPLFVDTFKNSIPVIKVDDVPTIRKLNEGKPKDYLCDRNESSNTKEKDYIKLGLTSLDNNTSDNERNDSKEEENETLLSSCNFGGNLTPLLKCSLSDVDDAFLTTFVNTPKTPKSGAAGYGLGMDFEDLFSGSSIELLNPRYSVSQSETAPPLSASLLNDWLGMNDIDPADFDDLQRELESTSYSLLDSA